MRTNTPLLTVLLAATALSAVHAADPLPSWNEGKAKEAIFEFVAQVTKESSTNFVPPAERIAVFDNDGTLWAEQPLYVQLRFALDRVKMLAPKHPEWRKTEPFSKLLTTPKEKMVPVSEKELMEIIMATHAGITTDEFAQIVADWLATAKHPTTGRLYTEMVYQPMLELLAHLRANGFKTYIASGGGTEFMRVFTERVYGVVPEQVIGSTIKTQYLFAGGEPVLMRMPELDFLDDKSGKPVAINNFIGRRPIAAFGNSDGDQQMLEWTTMAKGARFGLLVHHDDAQREWAYDRNSQVGRLAKALDEAPRRGWTVVSMKKDWKRIFPFGDK